MAQAKRMSERELQAKWQNRVATQQFSPAVVATREVRVFGKAGDAPVAFPQVRKPAAGESVDMVLDLLEPDERWALGHAQRVIEAHADRGRRAFAVMRGRGDGVVLDRFDPISDQDILILSQIAGG